MSAHQEAFARAKRAWEELDEVWQRGEQQTPRGRRALQGLNEALAALDAFMSDPEGEA